MALPRPFILATTAVVLMIGASCATPPPPPEISVPFDAENQAITDGLNQIVGSALIRQSGGGIVHCGGREVLLVGATDYSAELVLRVFGSTDAGYVRAARPGPDRRSVREAIVQAVNVHPDWWQAARITLCDAQGEFVFDDVADGAYLLLVSVVWNVPTRGLPSVQGGTMMSRIEVSGGKTHRLVISP